MDHEKGMPLRSTMLRSGAKRFGTRTPTLGPNNSRQSWTSTSSVRLVFLCYFQASDGEKRHYVINTRPFPTNGGLKLMEQCVPSEKGIGPRFLRPYAETGHLKGDADIFCLGRIINRRD